MMILHPTYFGPVGWYSALLTGDVRISTGDVYRRQTDRNRCTIITANGAQTLTVPVTLPEGCSGGRCLLSDVRISDHGNWRHQHWNALQSAYGMSPFFDYYADDLRPLFERSWQWLYDYDMETTAVMLRLLETPRPLLTVSERPTHHSTAFRGVVPEYYQTFQRRHGFIPDASILDFLFNEGKDVRALYAAKKV